MSTRGNARWRVVEGVVAAIERSLNSVAGTLVTGNAMVPERVSGQSRQVDVLVEIPTGRRTLRVGIEVKDESRSVDLPEMEQLVAKLSKLDVDFGCIVARSGFTSSARQEASSNGIELRTLEQIELPGWWAATHLVINHRKVDVAHSRIVFPPDKVETARALLAGRDSRQVEVVMTNGTTQQLLDFVAGHGVAALDRPELSALQDQSVFSVNILISDSTIREFRTTTDVLPMPVAVQAQFRLSSSSESVELVAFSPAEGLTALSGVSEQMAKQFTFVAQDSQDGSKHLSFSFEPAAPSSTVVPPRKLG